MVVDGVAQLEPRGRGLVFSTSNGGFLRDLGMVGRLAQWRTAVMWALS